MIPEEIDVSVVQHLQQRIRAEKNYSPVPNRFWIESITHLNHWQVAMLNYIIACTFAVGRDHFAYSQTWVQEQMAEGLLKGLPQRKELQKTVIESLAKLALIKIEGGGRTRKPMLIWLNFYTFWVEQMVLEKDSLVTNGYQTSNERLPDWTPAVTRLVTSRYDNKEREEKEIEKTSAKASGDGLFSKELDSSGKGFKEFQETRKKMEAEVDAKQKAKMRMPSTLFETPLVDEMINESNTPQRRVADFLLLKRKTFIDDPRHNLAKWAEDIDKAIRIDKRTEDQLMRIIKYIYSDAGKFWRAHIQSGAGLRKKFETIEGQRKTSSPNKKMQRRPV